MRYNTIQKLAGQLRADFDKDLKPKNANKIQRFVELIRSKNPKGTPNYKSIFLNEIAPFAAAYKVVIKDDKNTAMDDVFEWLNDIRRDKSPKAPLYIKWLVTYHREDALAFFKSCGKKYIAILDADVEFNSNIDAFLCWSGPYALALATEIRDFFTPYENEISVFLSSKDMKDGLWSKEIQISANEAAQGIAIVTQDVIDSSHLIHDLGLLNAQNSADRIKLLLVDTPMALLPSALRMYQLKPVNEDEIREFSASLFSLKKIGFPEDEFSDFMDNINRIRNEFSKKYVTSEEGRWENNVSRPLMASNQNGSPYDLEQVLRVAQERVVLVAQNHYFMTRTAGSGSERFWPMIEKKLIDGVNVDVIGMHSEIKPNSYDSDHAPSSLGVWSHFMNSKEFFEHTRDCWDALENWSSRYDELRKGLKEGHGEFAIYGAYFTPVTMAVVDPDSDTSFMVISPRIGHEASGTRPHFILRRHHDEQAFQYFWQSIENSFANAGWRRLFATK